MDRRRAYRDVDTAGDVALHHAVHDARHAGVRHPHARHRQVRHVQERVTADQIIPSPAVRILRQESGKFCVQNLNFSICKPIRNIAHPAGLYLSCFLKRSISKL